MDDENPRPHRRQLCPVDRDPDPRPGRRQSAARVVADRHSRTGARDFRLLADKAYSHDSTRNYLRQRRIPHTIPERSDQIARRQAKGSHGGRPPGFDPTTYRQRNTIERGFNRLKHWRGVATRYDKYALTFLGGVTLATVITYHRIHN